MLHSASVSRGRCAAQPYYRWDGTHHFHDIALLALERPLSQTPARLAEQRPGAGKSLLIAGYGRQLDEGPPEGPSELRIGQIEAADPATCHLISEAFNPSWLFCGRASSDHLVLPGGTACFGDSGGPLFASENTRATSSSKASSATTRESTAILALLSTPSAARLHRSSARHAAGRVEPPAGRPAHCRGQAGQPQGRPDGIPARAHRRRQEQPLAGRHHVPHRRTAGRAGLPQRPHQSLGEDQAPRRVQATLRLDLRAGTDGTKKQSNRACAHDVVR